MLSMKTLRVAIVTMGSALLLGPGLAMAQTNLNATGDEAPTPLTYAQETLGAPDANGLRALELPGEQDIVVDPRRAIEADEGVYLRIDLTGAMFGSTDPDVVIVAPNATTTVDADSVLSAGGDGESFAVFKLSDVGVDDLVGVRIPDGSGAPDDLMMTTASGSVTVSITAYNDPDDAIDEIGARSTFSGSGTIIRFTTGLDLTIDPADTAIASVDLGFLAFRGGIGQARLGWLGLQEKDSTTGVLNATSGAELARGDILANDGTAPDGTISFNVMGNLNIGAFSLIEETYAADGEGNLTVPTESCAGVDEGAVDRGTLVDADGMMLIGEEGEMPSGVDAASSGSLAPSVYLLCVNVDVMGPETNMSAIPNADYSAMASYKTGNNVLEVAQMAGEGDLGSIRRDGASVNIPYLTTSEKHNQRLIVVNRGPRDAAITSIQFTMEDGTEVELMAPVQAAMDAGLLAVPAGQAWVARMDETITISGGSRRVAATVSFAATAGNLSVATTQVNVSDGSTDTVVYNVF